MKIRAGILLMCAALLTACGGGNDAATPTLEHIHGLGVNPGDGALYVASHHGVFRMSGEGEPEQIAGLTRDFMGFTVIGADHFLASGHPGPGESQQPSHLGLIESTDAAQSWTPVSLAGEADFHAMDTVDDTIYGYDSVSGQLMVSTDRHNWDRRAELGIADIAVAPDRPDDVVATTRQGPVVSTDGGRTFAGVADAPLLALVDWPEPAHLVGVAADGTVYVSSDRGAGWERRGQVAGAPQAVTSVGPTDVYIATENAIHHSSDGATTFTVFQEL